MSGRNAKRQTQTSKALFSIASGVIVLGLVVAVIVLGVLLGQSNGQVSTLQKNVTDLSALIGTIDILTGAGLTGGPITSTGTIALADTAVTPGSYTSADVTIDQQGRITAASSNAMSADFAIAQNIGAGNVTWAATTFAPWPNINAGGGIAWDANTKLFTVTSAGRYMITFFDLDAGGTGSTQLSLVISGSTAYGMPFTNIASMAFSGVFIIGAGATVGILTDSTITLSAATGVTVSTVAAYMSIQRVA